MGQTYTFDRMWISRQFRASVALFLNRFIALTTASPPLHATYFQSQLHAAAFRRSNINYFECASRFGNRCLPPLSSSPGATKPTYLSTLCQRSDPNTAVLTIKKYLLISALYFAPFRRVTRFMKFSFFKQLTFFKFLKFSYSVKIFRAADSFMLI